MSLNTKVFMLRCFFKEIISINVPFLMYWMLPSGSIIYLASVILPPKYLAKLISTAYIAQKLKFSIQDFFSKCDQICCKLRIWSHLLKKCLMENLFCSAIPFYGHIYYTAKYIKITKRSRK